MSRKKSVPETSFWPKASDPHGIGDPRAKGPPANKGWLLRINTGETIIITSHTRWMTSLTLTPGVSKHSPAMAWPHCQNMLATKRISICEEKMKGIFRRTDGIFQTMLLYQSAVCCVPRSVFRETETKTGEEQWWCRWRQARRWPSFQDDSMASRLHPRLFYSSPDEGHWPSA